MRKQAKKIKRRNIIIGINAVLIGILVIAYLGISMYFKDKFIFGTYINDMDFSGKTVEEAEQIITYEIRSYSLTLEERDDITETIHSGDINMQTVFDISLEDLKKEQSPYKWIIGLFKPEKHDISTMLTYDDELLKEAFNNLDCFKEENIVKPVDAHISDYTENGYEIVEAVNGNEVKKEKLYDLVVKYIEDLEPVLSLEDNDCYEKPTVAADSQDLVKVADTLNKYVGTTITYEFGDNIEVVDGSVISEWLEVTDDNKVVFNKENVRKYVDYLGYTYNTFGATRQFDTSYGKTVSVSGGDYGWWLNRVAEVDELIAAVQNGENITKEPNYFQKAGSYGKNDIGNTYVEINLKAQHLFFYKEGKLIVESDIVSGNLAKNYGTPTGTYSLTYKERDATLVGEDYNTPVSYWMPFNNNIGLHDATWRTEFGGNKYLTSGSHGCINLPYEVAKVIYENIEKGVAVICYELDITDNDTDTKNKNKTDNETSNKSDKKSEKPYIIY